MNNQINEEMELLKNDPEKVKAFAEKIRERMKKENKSFQEIVGIEDDQLESLYNAAYNYYNLGKYEEAFTLFTFLSSLANNNPRFLFGLASTSYQLGYYLDASLSYILTLNHEPTNVMASYFLSDCFIKMSCFDEAIEALNYTLTLTENRPEYEAISTRSTLLKEGILTKREKT
jgi:tetratricopeptide (TPR) repeat protein